MNDDILALRIALANLLEAYKELSGMFCKKPDLNLFYLQAKILMKEYHHESSPKYRGEYKFSVPEDK